MKAPEVSTRYRVRQTTSGYSGVTKFNVWDTVDKGRVNVHAHLSRAGAQLQADGLNISDMIRDYDDDPRPYAERRAEAEAIYRAAQEAQ